MSLKSRQVVVAYWLIPRLRALGSGIGGPFPPFGFICREESYEEDLVALRSVISPAATISSKVFSLSRS
jgi:hypothetical protein